jgi:hypothetical protein
MPNQFGIDRGEIKDFLTRNRYYNIACLLLAAQGEIEHLIHFYGERGAFKELRETMDYSNFLRNADRSTFPMAVNTEKQLLRPIFTIASAILAGFEDFYYMECREPAGDYGESWLGDYQHKDKIVSFYESIISSQSP